MLFPLSDAPSSVRPQNTTYTVVIRHSAGLTTLQTGVPSDGTVAAGQYDYYSVFVTDTTAPSLILDLTVFSGDADLFVGTDRSNWPSIGNANVCGSRKGCGWVWNARVFTRPSRTGSSERYSFCQGETADFSPFTTQCKRAPRPDPLFCAS